VIRARLVRPPATMTQVETVAALKPGDRRPRRAAMIGQLLLGPTTLDPDCADH
jgi:hypothetical protein